MKYWYKRSLRDHGALPISWEGYVITFSLLIFLLWNFNRAILNEGIIFGIIESVIVVLIVFYFVNPRIK